MLLHVRETSEHTACVAAYAREHGQRASALGESGHRDTCVLQHVREHIPLPEWEQRRHTAGAKRAHRCAAACARLAAEHMPTPGRAAGGASAKGSEHIVCAAACAHAHVCSSGRSKEDTPMCRLMCVSTCPLAMRMTSGHIVLTCVCVPLHVRKHAPDRRAEAKQTHLCAAACA